MYFIKLSQIKLNIFWLITETTNHEYLLTNREYNASIYNENKQSKYIRRMNSII